MSEAKWTKLPALPGRVNPCGNCPPIVPVLSLDQRIAVGFGTAAVTRDGETVFDEMEAEHAGEDLWTVSVAEAQAIVDPNHDWRIVLHGPLHGETYQRHGPNDWVLIEKNEGFA